MKTARINTTSAENRKSKFTKLFGGKKQFQENLHSSNANKKTYSTILNAGNMVGDSIKHEIVCIFGMVGKAKLRQIFNHRDETLMNLC